MRNTVTGSSASCLLFAWFALGAVSCSAHSDPPPPQAPPPAGTATPLDTQTFGHGDGTSPGLATSQAAPASSAPSAPSAPLSTPNPLALPCTVDANCVTHRCNVPAQKCAWPCQTDNDCMPGNACIAPTCLPKLQ